MRKFLVVLVVAIFALPVFGQTFKIFKPEAVSLASVSGDDCVIFPKSGKKICISQDGNGFVFNGNVLLENGGRLYGSNGMSVSAGEGANGAIYLGDVYENGGVAIGDGGMTVQGNISQRTWDGLSYMRPVMSNDALTVMTSDRDETAGIEIKINSQFRSISNLDLATKGGYRVYCFSRDPADAVAVAQNDMYPDHFVARSLSGRATKFWYRIEAKRDTKSSQSQNSGSYTWEPPLTQEERLERTLQMMKQEFQPPQ